MKKITLLFTAILAATTFLSAQADLIIFSEQGERFTLVVNGEAINAEPQTNVRANNINAEWIKVKAVFEDKALGSVDGNLALELGSECTYMIKMGKKGDYKFAYRGVAPINRPMEQPVVARAQPTPPPPAPAPANNVVVGQTVVTQTTTTQTDGVSVGMSVPDGMGGNVSVGINVSGMGMDMGAQTTTQTVTHTTVTQVGTPPPPAPAPVAQPVQQGCYPMAAGEFNNARNSINSKDFEDTKLTLAKQVAKNNCLTAAQIRDICKDFTFEESRLDFAKFAYPNCYDPRNYYMVNDAFEFETSSSELARFTGN